MAQHGHSIANITDKSITRRNQKRKKTKEKVHSGQPPLRAARGGCHGWIVVVHTAVAAVPPPGLYLGDANSG